MDWKDKAILLASCVFSGVISGLVMVVTGRMLPLWGVIAAIPIVCLIGFGFGKLGAYIVRMRHE